MDASNMKGGASSPLPSIMSPKKGSTSFMDQNTRPPSLLPAFEPFSSSPPAARLSKKRPHESLTAANHYPTPVPTSSTGILPSSPRQARPLLQRSTSTMSERAPLSNVPTVKVPADGTPLTLGRASTSCTFKLPYNRLISRLHVTVTYKTPTPDNATERVEIQCNGWNGCKVLYKGRTEELAKDESISLTDPTAEIMLDVLDSRVILAWPFISKGLFGQGLSWLNTSPSRSKNPLADPFNSSPPPRHASLPNSPSKAMLPSPAKDQSWPVSSVKIYEDPSLEDMNDENAAPISISHLPPPLPTHGPQYTENENEENEPIVHQFGPFGSNILKRLHSITASSPEQSSKRRKLQNVGDVSGTSSPLSSLSQSPTRPERSFESISRKHANESPIKNHVINQLAFSRVHSTPISTIFKALPANLKLDNSSENPYELTPAMLRSMLKAIPCVGEIDRNGKDAAGKPLENEFYYLPDQDENQMRRETVVNGMGSTSIRAVRKNHKVCPALFVSMQLLTTV